MIFSFSYILIVIPAKAGIQLMAEPKLGPRLRGDDEFINLYIQKQR
jgi:hypothetical protein